MIAIVRQRVMIGILSILALLPFSIQSLAVKAGQVWLSNKGAILTLAAVNTAITSGMELVTRSVSSPFTKKPERNGFFVQKPQGLSINKQSLTNIWMTLFASLFGGIVFFIGSLRSRFAFFLLFGLINSFIGQSLSSVFVEAQEMISSDRLYFDLAYMASLKFLVFEWGRQAIIEAHTRIFNLGGIRLGQDFLTTFLKVSLLNLFGIYG